MTSISLSASNNATWTFGPFALRDTNDILIPLAGAVEITMQVRSQPNDIEARLSLALERGISIVNFFGSEVLIDVPHTTTKDIAAGSYVWDIRVVQPTGRAHRPVFGTLSVIQGVTR
ncbi:MAG: hypothetical protein B7Z40_15345 [Bosea sp. 12-68-7]|nr:MAG: hypothetical protein B7Z40_15345 [Bosea sp. 12-68-7]OYX01131.1 MAG: hypothetical protein B7Z14_07090 [Bosea sp. 32-68-6]